jgi:hypothetical protein
MRGDHERLRALLDRAPHDADAYVAFREGLLRHVAMEEKVLLLEAARARGGEPLSVARQLRLDHSAIGAMLVPSPTPRLLARLRELLALHDPLEEGEGGAYAECDRVLAGRADAIVARLQAMPPVPMAKHFDDPRAFDRIDALVDAAMAGRRGM